ncbi:MAG: hypothetical protein EHM42_03960, partial [Planctomycetaceae bacterium]
MAAAPLKPTEVLKRLHPLVVSAFSVEELQLCLKISLDWSLSEIVNTSANLRSVAFEVIEYANRQGMLPELVAALSAERPKLAELSRLLAEMQGVVAGLQKETPPPGLDSGTA